MTTYPQSSRTRLALMFLVMAALFSTVVAQSGRRVSSAATPPAPIQPPLHPEPEPAPKVESSDFLFIPESIREREIKPIETSSFKLSEFEGKVVVINIWASWCGPCRREVPEYEKVRVEYAGRDVEFIGLTTEDPGTSSERVKKFLNDVNFGFRLGWADKQVARTLMNGKPAIPQTIVLDGRGRVVSHWTGYSPGRSGKRLQQTIDGALSDN